MVSDAEAGRRRELIERAEYSRRMEDEIERLESAASRLKGREREAVLEMARILRAERRQLDSAPTEEMEHDQASIIGSLNDIEAQVKELERSIDMKESGCTISKDEADEKVNRFFISCQIAEDRIKRAYSSGHITSKQVESLNAELRVLVKRMFALSRRCEPLLDAVLSALEARLVA